MNKDIKIGRRIIGKEHPVFIIAEAGVNHNGSLALAKKLIDAAKEVGADAIKFQTFEAAALTTKKLQQADYQKKNSWATNQYSMLKKLELSKDQFIILKTYCQKKKILFLSTPFDQKSAEFLDWLGVPAFKISSGDLTNTPLLFQIACYGKPIILSTGMSNINEVKEAVRLILRSGNKQLILLHCTSNYPADYTQLNLSAIHTLKDTLGVLVGFSDHSEGIEASIAAVALGARVIEKHFTLDNKLFGPDHKMSLEPVKFAAMVKAIRHTECAIGNGIKDFQRSETALRLIARKSVVVLVDLERETKISPEMLTIKRPAGGIEPKYIDKLIGRQLKHSIKKDTVLTWSALR